MSNRNEFFFLLFNLIFNIFLGTTNLAERFHKKRTQNTVRISSLNYRQL